MRDDADPIVQKVAGAALKHFQNNTIETKLEHQYKLKPTLHRNWNISEEKEAEVPQVVLNGNGLNKGQRKQLFSYESAFTEIQRHIDELNNNFMGESISDPNSLTYHLNIWLSTSLQANDIYIQYLKSLEDKDGRDMLEWILMLEDIGMQIEESLNIIIDRHDELSFKDFKMAVLALGNWLPLYRKSKNVPNKIQNKFAALMKALESGSFQRIFHLKLPVNSPNYLKRVPDRLDLAQVWIYAMTGGGSKETKHVTKIRGDTFPSRYIKRVTDRKMG